MGHFLDPLESPDVVQGLDGRRKSTMETEELVFNNGSKRQVIKEFGKGLPDRRIAILTTALVIEAVDLSNLAGLVIAS